MASIKFHESYKVEWLRADTFYPEVAFSQPTLAEKYREKQERLTALGNMFSAS